MLSMFRSTGRFGHCLINARFSQKEWFSFKNHSFKYEIIIFTRPSAFTPLKDLSSVTGVKTPEKASPTTPSQKSTGLTHYPHSYAFGAKRRMFDKGPDVSVKLFFITGFTFLNRDKMWHLSFNKVTRKRRTIWRVWRRRQSPPCCF